MRAVSAIPGLIGRLSIQAAGAIGRSSIFFARAASGTVQAPIRWRLIVEHIHFIGNRSLSIVLLTAGFTGMVLALQGYHTLVRVGSVAFLGPLVALGLIRELGPVLAALMVTARAGSSIATTIGGMRVTEQIDAMEAMAVDPVQYLVSPRVIAALVAVPLLTALFDVAGLSTAYVLSTEVLDVDGGTFITRVAEAVGWADVVAGLWKSVAFAGIIAWVSTYQGFTASGGAEGVGRATTQAVVMASVGILGVDYLMTAMLF